MNKEYVVTGGVDKKSRLIVAVYNNSKLDDIRMFDAESDTIKYIDSMAFNLTNKDYIKCYIWSGKDTMTPLAESWKVNLDKGNYEIEIVEKD